jgi:hypothetical protein
MTDTASATTFDRTAVVLALRSGGIVDITTTGRQSGQPRRIEIVFFHIDGRIWISGLPGRRSWYANLRDDARLAFHLKVGPVVDLPARAILVEDEATRRSILARITRAWKREAQLDQFVEGAPLIEVVLDDPTLLGG